MKNDIILAKIEQKDYYYNIYYYYYYYYCWAEKQKYCLIFCRAEKRKVWNYFFTRRRWWREKLKCILIIESIIGSRRVRDSRTKQRGSDREVNRHPGGDMIVMETFHILTTEKKVDLFSFFFGRLGNFHDVTCWAHDRKSCPQGENLQQPTRSSGKNILLPWLTVTESHRLKWELRNYEWNYLLKSDEEKPVDEIHPLGNRKEYHKNKVFSRW